MKISRDWLTDFVDWIETDPTVMSDRLTRCVGEVDDVIEQGAFMDRCVVGRVMTLDKHPNADTLSVCTVQTDEGIKHVVCGGTNLRQGMPVAFAHVGATVKVHGKETLTLEAVKIRGELSEGMICAAEELALEDLFAPAPADGDRPIIDLGRLEAQSSRLHPAFASEAPAGKPAFASEAPAGKPAFVPASAGKPAFAPASAGTQDFGEQAQLRAGMPLRQALGLTDVIFCIDNHAITNRPDLFSHVGVARELVALGLARWKEKPAARKIVFPKTALLLSCINECPKLVPRYCACTLSIDSVGVTPDWMRRRLEATGWRSINLPVDITNYVSMELGMPLHSFDVDDLAGAVHIRTAKKGESIVTLDEVQRPLPEGAIVLSDDKGIFDLLGIMGGLRSSTKASTRNIYLHAAIADPVSIRRTIIATGHRTDASTVYEKGIPTISALEGFLRALELLQQLAPGIRVTSPMESWGKDDPKKAIAIPLGLLCSMMGTDIKPVRVKRILCDLGFAVKTAGKNLRVTPPAWRRDLSHAQDIIEEVARIYGYENVEPQMPDASIKPPTRETRMHRLRETLSEAGATELVSLAFTSPQQCQKWNLDVRDAVSIENPIGEEVSLMRLSLVPGLTETAARELKHTESSHLKMYEVGRIFSKKGERNKLALTVVAHGKTTLKDIPLLIAKADLEWALRSAGYEATVQKVMLRDPSTGSEQAQLADARAPQHDNLVKGGGPENYSPGEGRPIAHTGRNAKIVCQNTVVGCLFELHPALLTTLGLPERTAVGALDLDTLLALTPKVVIAQPLPLYPAVSVDESVPPPQKRTYAELKAALRAIDPLLKAIEIVNLYEKDTTKAVTMRFTYRSPDRTLTQEEVEKIHAKVLLELKKQ